MIIHVPSPQATSRTLRGAPLLPYGKKDGLPWARVVRSSHARLSLREQRGKGADVVSTRHDGTRFRNSLLPCRGGVIRAVGYEGGARRR